MGLPSNVLKFFNSTVLGCPPLFVKTIFIKSFSKVSKCSVVSVIKAAGNFCLASKIESFNCISFVTAAVSTFGFAFAVESSTRFFSAIYAWLLRLLMINIAISKAPINTKPITVFLSIPMFACFKPDNYRVANIIKV